MNSARNRPPRGSNQPENRPGWLAGIVLALGSLLAGLFWWLNRGRNLEPASQSVDATSVRAGHEVHDASLRSLAPWIIALIVMVLVAIGIATGFQALMTGHLGAIVPTIAIPPNVQPPPAPRLETGNGQVLEELHATEDKILNNYTWIDQNSGKVSIPIDHAMDLLLQRGLPTRPQAGNAAGGSLARPQDSSSGRTEEKTIP